ncbi:cytochrome P450 [Kibdelosporangium banguiense]|uniref:Cytochrome P450 n=1 Tax=Kibdelosporangium banguiense TaxID=1365924 RepID=A0ABS4TME6_9PSEU|nr:cytochrome P450 [Kibdelosporangium banguiense]MBP2325061.1 cytochrome P450 [Kibdelosporangium banguiense]
MTTATLPPGPNVPPVVQAVYALTVPRRGMPQLCKRYGDAFTVNALLFGRALVLSNPAEIKQLFLTPPDIVDNLERNLGRVLGPGSMFALRGEQHRKQRKLLVPPFHGRRLAAYEQIIEEETVRELARWPQGRSFATLPSMMRITLNAILRAVFGAEGEEFDQLRELLPRAVTFGSRLAVLPIPTVDWGRWSPWGRFWLMRREYDAIVEKLIAKAEQDKNLDERNDVLALLLQSRYDDGSKMSHSDIADQLLTLLSAGHETTATTLAWAVERLRRHPEVLQDLVAEVDAGGSTLREATILEVQRTRPVIDLVGRQVKAESLQLGRWTLPKGAAIIVSISLLHENESVFPNARKFDPSRFVGARPDLYQWIPFGGGTRRCLGAAFANMEMNVVLRTMLRDFTLIPTAEGDERWHSRGIASAPGKGGQALVRRRARQTGPSVQTRSTDAATTP